MVFLTKGVVFNIACTTLLRQPLGVGRGRLLICIVWQMHSQISHNVNILYIIAKICDFHVYIYYLHYTFLYVNYLLILK